MRNFPLYLFRLHQQQATNGTFLINCTYQDFINSSFVNIYEEVHMEMYITVDKIEALNIIEDKVFVSVRLSRHYKIIEFGSS